MSSGLLPDVTVVESSSKNLDELVNGLLDIHAPRSFNGMRVLVKPNMLGPFPGDSGIVTHPDLLRAVVRGLLDRGAKVAVGDNSGGIVHSTTHVAHVTGFDVASEGCFMPLSERVVEVPAQSEHVDSFVVSRAILDTDFVVDVPILKTHVLTLLTGAVKNCFGYIAGHQKAALHMKAPSRTRFSSMVVDVYRVRPPDLTIMDAITIMDGNGPTHGAIHPFGRILAGANAVSVDAAAARLLGIDPHEVLHLDIAGRLELGTLDGLRVIGPQDVFPGLQQPTTFGPVTEEIRQALVRGADIIIQRANSKPVVNEGKCISCGECETNCPPQAIKLDPFPIIADGCITCYCCVELCPEGALDAPEMPQAPL